MVKDPLNTGSNAKSDDIQIVSDLYNGQNCHDMSNVILSDWFGIPCK